jgi:hypothetical protein
VQSKGGRDSGRGRGESGDSPPILDAAGSSQRSQDAEELGIDTGRAPHVCTLACPDNESSHQGPSHRWRALAIVVSASVHGVFASAGLMRRHFRFSRSSLRLRRATVILQFDIGLRRTPDLADPAVMKPTIYQSSIGCGPSNRWIGKQTFGST